MAPDAKLHIGSTGYNTIPIRIGGAGGGVLESQIVIAGATDAGAGWGSTIIGRNILTTGLNNRPRIFATAQGQTLGTAISLASSENAQDGAIVFYASTGTNFTELKPRMTIRPDGKIGFGTTTPVRRFEICPVVSVNPSCAGVKEVIDNYGGDLYGLEQFGNPPDTCNGDIYYEYQCSIYDLKICTDTMAVPLGGGDFYYRNVICKLEGKLIWENSDPYIIQQP
jgi:hypothetical protein